MGCDARAVLAFGVDLGENLPEFFTRDEFGYFDLEDFVCLAAGLENPGYLSPEYAEFAEKRKELVEKFPAKLCLYGVEDRRRYLLYVNGSDLETTHHEPKPIQVSNLRLPPAAVAAFQEFCESLGITQEPRWLMVSRYM